MVTDTMYTYSVFIEILLCSGAIFLFPCQIQSMARFECSTVYSHDVACSYILVYHTMLLCQHYFDINIAVSAHNRTKEH